ncbi:MAG TPA: hypothetical protein VFE78_09740 [Gemmataceae bacterium]|jgi:hypothetical protein|nr:hypothetical protein [Gemmataceae bacterium]
MRSVASALGWELWRQNRVFFILTAAYPPAAAVVLRFLPGGELGEAIALLALAPLAAAAVLLLAVFTYSLRADLTASASHFPGRLFTVPARTAALVAWPMLYGALAAALWWLAAALLILRPSGVAAPLAWPALGAVAFTVWMQAALWWPIGWPLARLVAPGLLTVAAVMVPRWWADSGVPEWPAVPLLAALAPLGYAAAVAGVARARRGDGQHWPVPRLLRAGPRAPRPPFPSAAAALLWWEWRLSALPMLVVSAVLLPLFAAPALFPGGKEMTLGGRLAPVLMLPLLLAQGAGASLGQVGAPGPNRKPGCSPFLATRPVPCAAWVAVKWKAAGLCTLTVWALPALVVGFVLSRPENAAEVKRSWALLVQVCPPWKAAIIVALAVAGLLALTWRGMVANLCVVLTGRTWVGGAAVTGSLVLLMGLALAGILVSQHPETWGPLRRLAWWLAPVAVALKLLLAGWAVRALRRRRLVSSRALVGWLAVWLLAAFVLFGAFTWLLPPEVVGAAGCACAAVLLVPLARLALAPLALEWNRHR